MTTYSAYEIVEESTRTGTAWGRQEVQLWIDQHGTMAHAPAWTRGNWAGDLPDDGTRDLVEAIIDVNAERVWEDAR